MILVLLKVLKNYISTQNVGWKYPLKDGRTEEHMWWWSEMGLWIWNRCAYLKLGIDFPFTRRMLSESSVSGSSVVAKAFFFWILEALNWKETMYIFCQNSKMIPNWTKIKLNWTKSGLRWSPKNWKEGTKLWQMAFQN